MVAVQLILVSLVFAFLVVYAFHFSEAQYNAHQDEVGQNDKSTDAHNGNVNIDIYDCAFKEETLVRLKERYIAIDFETTGLNPKTDRIIEIGAVVFENGKPTKTFSTLVNPGIPIPARATQINHISNATVMFAPSESSAISQFVDFLGNALQGETIICAHNADFDMKFLGETLIRQGYSGTLDSVDTLAIARKMVSGIENYKLTTLIEHYGIEIGQAHRANSDALACGKLLAIFLDEKKDEK